MSARSRARSRVEAKRWFGSFARQRLMTRALSDGAGDLTEHLQVQRRRRSAVERDGRQEEVALSIHKWHLRVDLLKLRAMGEYPARGAISHDFRSKRNRPSPNAASRSPASTRRLTRARGWSSKTRTATRSTCGKQPCLVPPLHGSGSVVTTASHIRSADCSTAGTSSTRRKRWRIRSSAARLTLSR